jgi:hypothetical protein
MKSTLLEIDSAFCVHYRNLLDTQRGISKTLESYDFDINKDEITQAVLKRMSAFWYFNVNNCKDLGRGVNTVAADFLLKPVYFF